MKTIKIGYEKMEVKLLELLITFLLIQFVMCTPEFFNAERRTINVAKAVSYYNSIPSSTWKAGHNDWNSEMKLSDLESRLGASMSVDNLIQQEKVQSEKEDNTGQVYKDEDLPDFYDARIMFPHCTSIGSIKDQARCGSCWAVSTAAAMSDRLCIRSKGQINVNISSENLMACDFRSNGCKGGNPLYGWVHIMKQGLVTGGDFDSFEGCQPYTIAPCGNRGQLPCARKDALTPKCRRKKCSNEWHSEFGRVYKVSSYTVIDNKNETDIRREIYRNGPIIAAFMIYPSFGFYKSGIYQMNVKEGETALGGHAVKVVGWGQENGIKYWIGVNSWGKKWGADGTFKIVRGTNNCQFEEWITGGIPIVKEF